MNWDDLKVVLALARAGTLAGAARDLGVDATTVGRRVAALEAALRARMFDRLSGGYVATGAGHRAIALAEEMEGAARSFRNEIEGTDQRIEGPVRLTGWTRS
jgi:DNA-binding transcriptional LysR family regulator